MSNTTPPNDFTSSPPPSGSGDDDDRDDVSRLRAELLLMAHLALEGAQFAVVFDLASRPNMVNTLALHHAARLREIIATYGWPGYGLVGRDGADAAWLVLQHAEADLDFQKHCLGLLEAAVAAHDADAVHFAQLADRVAVAEGHSQRFGTLVREDGEPTPIEDEANVDSRRAAIGLPSMAAARRERATTHRHGRTEEPTDDD